MAIGMFRQIPRTQSSIANILDSLAVALEVLSSEKIKCLYDRADHRQRSEHGSIVDVSAWSWPEAQATATQGRPEAARLDEQCPCHGTDPRSGYRDPVRPGLLRGR